MMRHIVFWEKRPEAGEGDLLEVKRRLEALQGRIDGLLHIEVGVDVSKSDASADLALYSAFRDADALAHYQSHPDHQAVIPLVQRCCCDRQVVDYCCD